MATRDTGLEWETATSLTSKDAREQIAPMGSLVHDSRHNCDQVAVVYNKGQTPPHITVTQISRSVHTIHADGVAVAIIAGASRPTLDPADVLLVERSV
ncbi:MAG TPA: hypothetical protein ENH56_16470 [Roseobacter sp.]|uniref:Uncharacterized protein n=1 Tax=marine sediment metagenome TaxID=412755 RepID=A0A0F9L4L4_9ZZZZ|nr:hypothetical protein [Roseobacter sp.]HEC70964.1 hypothetical protein [Roseobacter sp.]